MGRGVFAAVVASVAAVSTPAAAQYFTGNDLLRECDEGDSPDTGSAAYGVCVGYIVGIADYLELSRLGKLPRCIPHGVTSGQLVDVVRKSLRDFPQLRYLPAPEFVAGTFLLAWNCVRN
jgi:Rap1a immunity proteins